MPIRNVRSSGGIAPASTIACFRVSHLRQHKEVVSTRWMSASRQQYTNCLPILLPARLTTCGRMPSSPSQVFEAAACSAGTAGWTQPEAVPYRNSSIVRTGVMRHGGCLEATPVGEAGEDGGRRPPDEGGVQRGVLPAARLQHVHQQRHKAVAHHQAPAKQPKLRQSAQKLGSCASWGKTALGNYLPKEFVRQNQAAESRWVDPSQSYAAKQCQCPCLVKMLPSCTVRMGVS